MKDFKIDTHTHTLISGHAYNTIDEMIKEATDKNMEVLCITDHGPAMPGSGHPFYFSNMHILKSKRTPIPVLFGCEVNILDENGEVDLDEFCLQRQQLVIASLHSCCFREDVPKTANAVELCSKENCTNALLKIMENPYITIIGHPDDEIFPIDYELMVKKAKETSTIIELNNSSNNPEGFRKGARQRDLEYLKYCKEYGVYISLGSDAHLKEEIGEFPFILPILEEIDFPEELIINSNKELFFQKITEKRKKYGICN